MLLKSKAFAAVIAALMVILGVFIGCARHFSVQSHNLAALFKSDTIGTVSIDSGLSQIVKRSRSLIAVAEKCYPPDGEQAAFIAAVTEAAAALEDAKTPSAKFNAQNTLIETFDALYLLMQDDSGVSDVNKRLIETYNSEVKSDLSKLDAESYNKAAADYNRDYDSFPARCICPLLGIKRAELFS